MHVTRGRNHPWDIEDKNKHLLIKFDFNLNSRCGHFVSTMMSHVIWRLPCFVASSSLFVLQLNSEYKAKRLWYLANQFILTPEKESAYFAARYVTDFHLSCYPIDFD